MFFYLKITSKDKILLKTFLKFLLKLKSSPIILKYFAKKNKRKFFSILKSPHVNKTAQEQFEFRFYTKRLLINSLKPLKFFLFLKKVTSLSFSGIKLEIQSFFNVSKKNKSFKKVFNPDNLILFNKKNNLFEKVSFCNLNHKKYIQLFDYYGKVCLKNSFYI